MLFLVFLILTILIGVRGYLVVLIYICLRISDAKHLFIYLLGHLYAFFGKRSIWVLCPYFNWFICCLGVELYEFFIYFGYQPLIRYIICIYLFPLGMLSFCFVDVFTVWKFLFHLFPIGYFWFCFPCLSTHIENNVAKSSVKEITTCVFF